MDTLTTLQTATAVVDSFGTLLAHISLVLASFSGVASAAAALIPPGSLPDAVHKIINAAALNINHATNAADVLADKSANVGADSK